MGKSGNSAQWQSSVRRGGNLRNVGMALDPLPSEAAEPTMHVEQDPAESTAGGPAHDSAD
jgi:hypothetical protein